MFGDDDKVFFVKGVDQSSSTEIRNGTFGQWGGNGVYGKDGLHHGEGTITYPNGKVMKGIWENDKFKAERK